MSENIGEKTIAASKGGKDKIGGRAETEKENFK